jgi:hypothetical protein
MKHKTERFWLATHVDDMPSSGTTGGRKLAEARLKERFDITADYDPKVILGVQLERNREKRTMKCHQGDYVKAMLRKYDMTSCNPRDTPLEANVMAQIRELLNKGITGEQGKEKEFQTFEGEIMWLYRSRPDLHFLIGLFARFVRSAGETQMRWTKQLLRYLAHDPEKGIILAPGSKLYLHGGSDADWGGDEISQKSTSGDYLSLGTLGVIVCSSKLQRKVADSSTCAETYAAHELVRKTIEVEGKLREMGFNVPLPVKLKQDNDSVIKMGKNPIAHAGSKHYRIPQAFIRGAVDDGLVEFEEVSSAGNPADVFTKPSTRPKFHHDCDQLMGVQGPPRR